MIPALQGMVLGAVLALFLALGVTIFIQHEKLNAAQTHAERQTQENAALRAENGHWKMLTGEQNAKIAALSALQAKKKIALAKAAKAADEKTAPLLDLAAKIAALPVPPGDDCAAAKIFENIYLAQRP